ncbi:O-acetyl-ADP-ribose deacetylase (regulator of RNase III), contains Macro domain [Lachnospiraceae bacterium XPB1003]|nr:O-acetyl-ADP-ribose deacetylase (regulator of RNase III), contains Macro domain [Lachnospiraceae bacterium XPB1003]
MAFRIIRNDITKVSADAIVNTANPRPRYVSGTDYAIYMAAGADELLKERQKIGNIETGQAAVTPAFALSAKYIIHTVGPEWVDGEHGEREAVKSCYENSLCLAKDLGCESIAFPLIATGVYGFPKADALQIAVTVFSEFLSDTDMEIILVVFDEDSFVLSGKIFSGVDAFIDENYVSEKMDSEYTLGASAAAFSVGSIPIGESRRGRRLFKDAFRRLGRKDSARAESIKADIADDEECDGEYDAEPLMEAPMAMASTDRAGRSLNDLLDNVSETWQESLLRLIDEKGYTDTEVYKRANVDRKLFSKIRSNSQYQPKKITAVAFALALKLSLDETKDLLGRAGYALSPSSHFDLIIEYFIEQGVYDTYTINLALFEHKQPLLGE